MPREALRLLSDKSSLPVEGHNVGPLGDERAIGGGLAR